MVTLRSFNGKSLYVDITQVVRRRNLPVRTEKHNYLKFTHRFESYITSHCADNQQQKNIASYGNIVKECYAMTFLMIVSL